MLAEMTIENAFEILDRQIRDQIMGRVRLLISFTDTYQANVSIFHQLDEDGNHIFFIKPAFCFAKKISKQLFEELRNYKGEMTYDAFFDKYYNNLK